MKIQKKKYFFSGKGGGGVGVRVDVNQELKFFGKFQKKKKIGGGGGGGVRGGGGPGGGGWVGGRDPEISNSKSVWTAE